MQVFASPLGAVEVPNVPLTEFVFSNCKKHGDRDALVDCVSGAGLTFTGLEEQVKRAAFGLHKMGLRQKEVLCIYSPNMLEYAVAFHAVASLGGTVTTANPLYTAKELEHQLKDSGAVYIITVAPFLAKAREAAALLPEGTIKEIYVFGEASDGAPAFSSLTQELGELPEVSINPREDVVTIPYSSGTTGLPKGVLLTHYSMVANLMQLLVAESDVGDTGPHCYIGVLPFYHIYAMTVILNLSIVQGIKTMVMSRFDLKVFLETIQAHKVTYLHIVPPIVLALAKHPMVGEFDTSSLKVIFCGAAPLSGEVEEQVRKRLPNIVVKQAYGMTEAAPAIHVSITSNAKTGSVGFLLPSMEARVLDTETGKDLAVGEDGEIIVRGPNLMAGYLGRPDATKATIVDGWLHTGDVGHVDSEGYWFIVDRVKELIKYKGFQVPPAELEALLLTHEHIADAAVIGKPDLEAGELPKAFIVLKAGSHLEADAVAAWVAERVAPHKRLRGGVVTRESIPKSASGKILRRLLRDSTSA